MNPSSRPCQIDMWCPAQTSAHLGIDDGDLLALVNRGDLAAYRVGDQIRFRVADVEARAALVAA